MSIEPVEALPAEGAGRLRCFLLVGAGLLVLVFGLLVLLGRGGLPFPATLAGGQAPAPDFAFTTFDGQPLSLSDPSASSGQALAGKAVVLNFWASWCVPCRAEMPYFETTYRAYRERGVVFLGLAIQDDPASARAFLKELGITYPAGPDEGNEVALRYQLTGLPTTIFITRDRKIARKWTGALSEQQLVAFVEEIAR